MILAKKNWLIRLCFPLPVICSILSLI